MQTNIQIFTNDIFGEIRTCLVNNQIMFVGKDVATALGYTNTQKAIRDHVDSEDKLTERFVLSGQLRSIILINESGLYALILSSKLPQAKIFKRWVTNVVLPQIRKTGGYIPTTDAQGRQLTSEEIIDRDLVRLRTHVSYSLKGEKKVKVYMTWTMAGLHYLNSKLGYPNF